MTEASELGGLYCELNLPLEWVPMSEAAGAAAADELANQNCLKIILSLDEAVHDALDESIELSQELQRLDFKISIILELVARLVSQNTALPESVPLKLSPKAIHWSARTPPAPLGQSLQLKLYLDRRFPFPLCLTGRIASLEDVAGGCQVFVALDRMQEHTQELLEKYIFRCHRRHVARMKTGNSQ